MLFIDWLIGSSFLKGVLSHEAVDLAVVVAGPFAAQLTLDGPIVARVEDVGVAVGTQLMAIIGDVAVEVIAVLAVGKL